MTPDILLTFGLLSLTLAAVGLFGALSYIVTQRTRELAPPLWRASWQACSMA